MKLQIMINNILISWSLLILVLCWYSTSVTSQEVENEREFDYANGGEKGPARWGEIKKAWEACKFGGLQSPIDMSNPRVKIIGKSREMVMTYKPSNATVKNRGHDISLQWDIGAAGFLRINDTKYLLQQVHWHSPSEHTINGRRYGMELHLVHVNPDKNKLAVIGILYKIGKPDTFLSQLMRNISDMSDQKTQKELGVIDPREIILHSKKYYRYMGSLTVPPCTEGVIWTINYKIRTVSRDQVSLLREAVHDYANQNARPMQLLNNREISLMIGS